MRLTRLGLGVPVLIGALGVGTASAHVLIGSQTSSVRDIVYPACTHNGVHFNKQGHANCGLHKGWAAPAPDGPPPAATVPPTRGGTTPAHHGHSTHAGHPGQPSKPENPAKSAAAGHGSSTGHGNGHAYGHAKHRGGSGSAHGKSGHGKG